MRKKSRTRRARAPARAKKDRVTSNKWLYGTLSLGVAVAVAWCIVSSGTRVDNFGEDTDRVAQIPAGGELTITYPLDGTMFPPEIVRPTFRWEDTHPATNRWSLAVEFAAVGTPGDSPVEKIQRVAQSPEWTPTDQQWEAIKRGSIDQPARITVKGFDRSAEDQALTSAEVSIVTSTDEVGAPIFYREVNLPFSAAVRNPAEHIRWRFGTVGSKQQPPVVLEKMPVCGNCHSFTADGRTMSMDVDFANDKGSYTICPVSKEMFLCRENIITWGDFRKEEKKTFGLLSQISPDGRYVLSTVKDLSVFLAIDDNLAFSQLFFPVQGILCYYDRRTETFHALPGADDPKYVQSNPVWSPDGRHVVFARSEIHEVPGARVNELGLSVPEEVPDFVSGERTFLFDLYRIPFNDGKGGEPEPLRGASRNGKSNYFAKYSPDAKWIVFCQAESFMLLRPDSQLYIIPAEGGTARRLECNTDRMNSWHSWSPNSKWMVFSSKAYTIYTQLMLTHVDDRGHATPPVVLAHFSAANMAANIPEFVNTSADAIKQISFDDEFFADAIHLNAGDKYAEQEDFTRAAEEFQKAIEINPDNVYGYRAWALVLSKQGKLNRAEELLRKAREIAPEDHYVMWRLGEVLWLQAKSEEAERVYRDGISINPVFSPPYVGLARLLLERGDTRQGHNVLEELIRITPDDPQPYCFLGDSLLGSGETDEAVAMYSKALEKNADCFPAMLRWSQVLTASPNADPEARKRAIELATKACELTNYQRADALITLSDSHAAAGNLADAVSVAYKALQVASQLGQTEQANLARSRLRQYREQ